MMRQFYFVRRDMRKTFFSMLFFFFQVLLATIIAAIVTYNIGGYLDYYQTFQKINEYHMTSYRTFYRDIMQSNQELKEIRGETIDYPLLELYLQENKGFSFVTGIKLKNTRDVDVIVATGNFGKVYNYGDCEEIICAVGNKVQGVQVGDRVETEMGSIEALVSNILPRNAGYFSNSAFISLENKILLLVPYDLMKEDFLNKAEERKREFYMTNLIANFKGVNLNEREIELLTEELNQSKQVRIIPASYNRILLEQNDFMKHNLLFFSIILVIAIGFIGIGFAYAILELIEKNMREYVITLLYGETIVGIYIRNILYIVSAITIPILFGGIFLNITKVVEHVPFLTQIVIIVGLSFCFSIIPIIRITPTTLIRFLRRDD